MCGLTGIIGSGILPADLKILKQLIFVDSLRGHHSTGLCALDDIGNPITYKRALDGPDFLQLKTAMSILSEVDTPFIMAHNRHATKGGLGDASAHPFTHGDITLCHNGTLDTQSNLPDYKDFGVDSENICHAFDVKSAKEIIPILEGAFALSWYDESDASFNLVRNTERPLCLAFHKTRKVVYYASERKMLEAILDRNNITDATYTELESGKWVKFDLTDTNIKPLVCDIAIKPPAVYTPPSYGNWDVGYNSNNYSTKAYRKGTARTVVTDTLTAFGKKVGDAIEFYHRGVATAKKSKVGIMEGFTSDDPFKEVKCYNQKSNKVAGIYSATLTSHVHTPQGGFFVVTNPILVDLIDEDPNNYDLADEVAIAKGMVSTLSHDAIPF